MARKQTTIPKMPVFMDGATLFSQDPELVDPMWAVRQLKNQPQFRQPLLGAAREKGAWGRPGLEGDWALAYVAFVCSGFPDVKPWWAQAPDALWHECGFAEVPSYDAVRKNFNRLEDHADLFSQAAGLVIQHAIRSSDGLVGRDLHVDSTEAETNARLIHACPPDSPCWQRKKHPGGNPTAVTANADIQDVKSERQRVSEVPEDELTGAELLIGDASELRETNDGRLILQVGKYGCQYELLDPTAGVRAYTNQRGTKRLWAGFFNMKIIDHYTGAPIAVLVFSASIQEYHKYPDLLEMAIENMGEQVPRAVVADRGFAVKAVYKANTEKGIASVIPWRRTTEGRERSQDDTDRFDRHGIPRCKYCGATTRFVRFNKQNPQPRLTVKCEMGITAECREKQQTIYCKVDWRYLLPLWRTTEEYLALRDSHDRYERTHQHWRTRYRVGADNHALRPKRKGVKCQMLRAQAALLVEWLRVAAREGWNGSPRRNKRQAEAAFKGRLDDFLEARRFAGLHLPYGPKAVALGVGEMRPPPRPD